MFCSRTQQKTGMERDVNLLVLRQPAVRCQLHIWTPKIPNITEYEGFLFFFFCCCCKWDLFNRISMWCVMQTSPTLFKYHTIFCATVSLLRKHIWKVSFLATITSKSSLFVCWKADFSFWVSACYVLSVAARSALFLVFFIYLLSAYLLSPNCYGLECSQPAGPASACLFSAWSHFHKNRGISASELFQRWIHECPSSLCQKCLESAQFPAH